MFKLAAIIAAILIACDAQKMDVEDNDNIHLARMKLIFSHLSGRAALMEKLLESYREGIKWIDRYLP